MLKAPEDPQSVSEGGGDRHGSTYFQLSRVFPSDSVQERLLELVQQHRTRAGQDRAGLRAASPQLQAPLPPRGLRDD